MFYVEPVVGYRSWRVSDKSYLLHSAIIHSCTWPTDASLEATCWDTQHRHYANDDIPLVHESPHTWCTCGVHGFHDVEDALDYGGHSRAVVGAVMAWGKIMVHTLGFKAQYMRPLAFIEHKSKLERIERKDMIEQMVAKYSLPLLPQHDLTDYAYTWGKPLGASYLDDE
jgi:hypothetical protein